MSEAITFDIGQLDVLARRLRSLDDRDALVGIVEGLADRWVDRSRQVMGYDTGQLYNRTGLGRLASSGSTATARVKADTPYAGFHNYGTRYVAPNRFWNEGLAAAVLEARRLEGRLGTEIQRVLDSGGVWNPRALFD